VPGTRAAARWAAAVDATGEEGNVIFRYRPLDVIAPHHFGDLVELFRGVHAVDGVIDCCRRRAVQPLKAGKFGRRS
jgi:hypothetical protein